MCEAVERVRKDDHITYVCCRSNSKQQARAVIIKLYRVCPKFPHFPDFISLFIFLSRFSSSFGPNTP